MLESFLKIINGHKADEIVWTADINYWIDSQIARGLGQAKWHTEKGFLELCRELGIVPYFNYQYEKYNPFSSSFNEKVKYVEETADSKKWCAYSSPVDTSKPVRLRWITPVGEIYKLYVYCEASNSWAPHRFPIQNVEDMKVFLYLLENRKLEPANLDDYHQRMDLWAQYDGLPAIGMTQDPLAQMMHYWAGVENTAYFMADNLSMVQHAYSLMEEQEECVVDAICELAPPLVHILDNQSSDTMGGNFETYMAPRYQRIVEKFAKVGTRTVTHIDGKIWPLLKMTADIGFHGCEALTPNPDDISLQDIARLVPRKDFVLWGGIPAAMFSPSNTWNNMRDHVQELLDCWSGHPFIIGVGDCVPADGQIEFVRKISDMVRGLTYN